MMNTYTSTFTFTGYPTYSVVCPNHTINWDANYPPTLTGFNSYFSACGTTDVDFNPETTKFTTVYPNPASDRVTIDFYLDKTTPVTIEVYSIEGKLVFSNTVADVNPGFNYTYLDVDQFSGGVYVLKLLENSTMVDQRMLSVVK